jgi:hypothetical protein
MDGSHSRAPQNSGIHSCWFNRYKCAVLEQRAFSSCTTEPQRFVGWVDRMLIARFDLIHARTLRCSGLGFSLRSGPVAAVVDYSCPRMLSRDTLERIAYRTRLERVLVANRLLAKIANYRALVPRRSR